MDPVVKPQEDGQCRRMTVVIYRGRTGLPRCCAPRKDECVSAGGAMGFRLRGNDGDEIEDGFQFIRHPRAGGDPMLGYALRADAKLRALRARYRMTVNAVNDGGVLQRAPLGYALCANANLRDCTQALPKKRQSFADSGVFHSVRY